MSDFNSSLPIRTEEDGDVVVKIADSLVPAQQLEITADRRAKVDQVKLDSATDSVTVVADNLDIRDLAFATDKVDVTGSEVSLDATTLAALENIQAEVTATDFDIRDLSAAQDSVKAQLADGNGDYYSALNPLTVSISLDNQGDELNDHVKSAAVAVGASVNVEYTVPVGKTLVLAQYEGSASGKAKFELQVETAAASGVFTSRFVQFNSTANNNVSVQLKSAIKVLTGVKVRIVVTNRDLLPQDIYTTICGQLV